MADRSSNDAARHAESSPLTIRLLINALGMIADPVAAPTLVRALGDTRSDVRWLAAEGSIALQGKELVSLVQVPPAAQALLDALIEPAGPQGNA